MNKKIITLILALLIILVGKTEAATLTQKLGGGYTTQTIKEGRQVTMKFTNQRRTPCK